MIDYEKTGPDEPLVTQVTRDEGDPVGVNISLSQLDSIVGYAIDGLNPRIEFKPNHSENILNAYHETRQRLISILAIIEKIHPDAQTVLTIQKQFENYCTYGYREGTHD